MGSQSEEEPELFSDPPEHFDDEVSLGIRNFKITDFVDFVVFFLPLLEAGACILDVSLQFWWILKSMWKMSCALS